VKNYCKGLLLPGERKSIEPIAARLAPDSVQAMRQCLDHFVAKAPWSDEALVQQVRTEVLPAMQRHGPVVAWIVDDTGFPKKGRHRSESHINTAGNWGNKRKRQRCPKVERPRGEAEPAKYWISTLPSSTQLKALVKITGAGSTITPRYASQHMGSWWPSGTVFPPPPAPAILDSFPQGPASDFHPRGSPRTGRAT
jgi:SRSO17 transposase